MIRAGTRGEDGREHIVLGLSRENINRLVAGMPIRITGESISAPSIASISIFFGETEAVMEEDLREAGLITPQTIRSPQQVSETTKYIRGE